MNKQFNLSANISIRETDDPGVIVEGFEPNKGKHTVRTFSLDKAEDAKAHVIAISKSFPKDRAEDALKFIDDLSNNKS